jgi:lipopolysaccharide export LptBFGC system permease protein LptF
MVTRSIRRGVAILAGVATAVAFVTVMWGMPVANQRWRMLVYDEGRQGYPGADVRGGLLEKGANELSLSELTTRIEALRRAGTPDAARPFTRSLHMRWVVSVAPLLLAVFALGVCSVLPSAKRSVTVGLAAIFAYVAFYSFINPAAHWSGTGLRSPGVLTWIPNVVVALAGVAMLTRGRRPRPG